LLLVVAVAEPVTEVVVVPVDIRQEPHLLEHIQYQHQFRLVQVA